MQEGVDVVDDIGVTGAPHDQDLINDEILLGLFLQIHLFDRDAHICAHLIRGVHAPTSPLSNLDKVPVQPRRIGIGTDLLQAFDNVLLLGLVDLFLSSTWSSNTSGFR